MNLKQYHAELATYPEDIRESALTYAIELRNRFFDDEYLDLSSAIILFCRAIMAERNRVQGEVSA